MLVYIVDDNMDLCEFISFVLAHEGYTVHAFLCPVEALAHMQEHQLQPVVLVTDYNLPKMNGYELHQEVKQLAPEVKTIVISGRSVKGLIGGLHFMHKPFAHTHLIRLIKTVSGL